MGIHNTWMVEFVTDNENCPHRIKAVTGTPRCRFKVIADCEDVDCRKNTCPARPKGGTHLEPA